MTTAHAQCLCGDVTLEITLPSKWVAHCHCTMCRRVSGAPVMAFATVPFEDFVVTGSPRRFRSTGFGERWFCGECGTPLAMHVDHQPETIDFTIASLDAPERVVPQFHLFVEKRIAWFETADALPRHAGFRPDTRGLSGEIGVRP